MSQIGYARVSTKRVARSDKVEDGLQLGAALAAPA